MINQLTQWILNAIHTHGALSVFVGVLIEQVIVPIPSPAIIMGAGFMLVPKGIAWGPALWDMTLKIVVPGSIASTIGALLLYYIGLWSGKVFVDKFQRYLGFSWKDVEWMGQHISRRGEAATLFFMRAAPIVPLSLVSLVGGVLKIPIGVFLLWTFLGSIPRCYLLAVLGWQIGAGSEAIAKGVNRFESIVTLVMLVLVVGLVLYIRRNVRRQMPR